MWIFMLWVTCCWQRLFTNIGWWKLWLESCHIIWILDSNWHEQMHSWDFPCRYRRCGSAFYCHLVYVLGAMASPVYVFCHLILLPHPLFLLRFKGPLYNSWIFEEHYLLIINFLWAFISKCIIANFFYLENKLFNDVSLNAVLRCYSFGNKNLCEINSYFYKFSLRFSA